MMIHILNFNFSIGMVIEFSTVHSSKRLTVENYNLCDDTTDLDFNQIFSNEF